MSYDLRVCAGWQAFMKDILHKNNVPTATYIRTKNPEEAKDYIRKNSKTHSHAGILT